MSSCSARCVPNAGITITLNSPDPAMAPTVFAAYTRPTRRPASWPGPTTDAIASGKLAPQRNAAGNTAHIARNRSTWNMIHGLGESVGFSGQYGSDRAINHAAHATPPTTRSCVHPSARRARPARAKSEPALLPNPSAIRKTARMIENV
jgi:hypothetical protein